MIVIQLVFVHRIQTVFSFKKCFQTFFKNKLSQYYLYTSKTCNIRIFYIFLYEKIKITPVFMANIFISGV